MELDRLGVVTRPRLGWEGLDLGFALARQWFVPLWLLWWLSMLPLALLALLASGLHPAWWLLMLWWCKPLAEVPLLVWASRALFGEQQAPFRQCLALWRASLHRALIGQLLWRRLGSRRSFVLPITLLEGLRGRAARDRRRLLLDGDASPVWLTIVCYHFEAILWVSALALTQMLVPEGLPSLDLGSALSETDSPAYWISALAYLGAFSLIAPFYVCAGFALYLTRRTALEAWDLELAFRAAQEHQRGRQRRASRQHVLLLLALSALLLTPAPEAASLPSAEQSRALIEEILADPDFGAEREVRRWKPIAELEPDEADADPLSPRLGSILTFLAQSVQWIALGFAVVTLGLVLARILRDGRLDWTRVRSRRARAPLPRAFESLPEQDSADPDAVVAAVHTCLARKDGRGALALLYRGTLAHLARCGLTLPEGATEREVLRQARRHLAEQGALGPLPELIRAWQSLAYGQRLISLEQIERLLEHWRDWTRDQDSLGHAH